MPTHKVNLGQVDVSHLETDADFRQEAKKHLPKVISEAGKFAATTAWDAFVKSFKDMGLKPNATERNKFIREATDNYRKGLKASDKKQIEDLIVTELKKMKK